MGTQATHRLLQTRHYDALSRLERLRLTNERREILATRTHAYDLAGNLTRITDQRRGDLDYRYDATGQLLQAVQPQLSETFAFDPAGNLTDGSPQNKATLANTAAKDHAQWEEGLEHLTEQPRGERAPTISPVTRNLLKTYLNTSYTHDQEGNTIRKLHKGGKDEQPLSLDLHYDAENRLVKAVRQDGLEAQYLYDAFGRRIAKRVLEKSQQAQATGTYGARAGDISESTETLTCFVWDGDTLVQEVTPQRTVSYLYEPESFVPLAQVISDTPDSVYDPKAVSGKQLRAAEIELRGEEEAEKLKWLEVIDKAAAEQLKATLVERDRQEEETERQIREREAATDRFFYINTDHLGTPQEAVSDDGKIVWLARYKAWGRILKLDTAEIKQPFRFQGQYEDEETGLYYNRHRYYDPDSARYLTQDPIGLAGGNNSYAYVPNPTGWVDPLGLAGAKCGCDCEEILAEEGVVTGRHGDLKKIGGQQDSHHIYQDAAVNGITNYDYNDAPAISLQGRNTDGTTRGTPHYSANRVQDKASAGGLLGSETVVAYKSLKSAGLSPQAAKCATLKARGYFSGIGANAGTSTQTPSKRIRK